MSILNPNSWWRGDVMTPVVTVATSQGWAPMSLTITQLLDTLGSSPRDHCWELIATIGGVYLGHLYPWGVWSNADGWFLWSAIKDATAGPYLQVLSNDFYRILVCLVCSWGFRTRNPMIANWWKWDDRGLSIAGLAGTPLVGLHWIPPFGRGEIRDFSLGPRVSVLIMALLSLDPQLSILVCNVIKHAEEYWRILSR